MTSGALLIGLTATTAAAAASSAATASAASPSPGVSARVEGDSIRLDNGLLRVTVDRRRGALTSLEDVSTGGPPRALGLPGGSLYWDANADRVDPPADLGPGPKKGYYRPAAAADLARLTADTPGRAEVVVHAPHNDFFQFDAEYHFVLLRGVSGLYAYVAVAHGADLAAARLVQTRFVCRTVTDGTFDLWSVRPDAFVKIPTAAPVAKLMDATYRLADGTVKTKYLNSVYWAANPVYGVIGHTDAGATGLWMVEASPEYHNGGPVKQGQTVHDNVLLRVMQSVHFGASPVTVAAGEPWRKVYGPFLLYVNHAADARELWSDAVRRQAQEAAAWPYAWVDQAGYVKERGTVTGRLNLAGHTPAGAWVILAEPLARGEWTAQSKGYQFWTRAGADGSFAIPHVIPGRYTLYASGGDQPQDLSRDGVIVTAGATADLGTLDWHPATHGRTLWQIGTFDRSAGEFRNGGDARQYQMFAAYPKQFPNDVDFSVGKSDIRTDWNYAQWSWFAHDPKWRVHFDVPNTTTGTATLTIGFASAQPPHGRQTDLRVAVNGREVSAIHLPKTGTAGYRGGVQDSPWNVRVIPFDAGLLRAGANELTLAHADAEPFRVVASPTDENDDAPPGTGFPGQVMYDALRLELPE
jgi:rhamnogalacturonan endolyase